MSGKKTNRKRPVSRKKSSRNKNRQPLKLLFAALFVTGFVIFCLVFLGNLRKSLHSVPPSAPPQAEEIPPSRASLVAEIQLELDSALWRAGVPFDLLRIDTRQGIVHYEIRGAMPRRKILADLSRRISGLSPSIELKSSPDDRAVAIRHGRETLFLIDFREEDKAVPPPGPRPRMAIIIDDLGGDLSSARALLAIDLQLTFSVMPDVGKSREVAELAHSRKREVMLHIPMEPRSYPVADPGDTALFNNMTSQDVQQRMLDYLRQVPHVVGGNNHMGSAFTENEAGMAVVVGVLREKGLFFIDSRTSNRSVAAGAAEGAGIPFGARDVFLDNVRDVEAISREIHKLAGLARRKGQAIGICHPYPETIEALAREAGILRRQGIEVVPASKLVARSSRRAP